MRPSALALALTASSLLSSGFALAQPKPGDKPPPGKTDMEIDPDAKPEKKEPPPLPEAKPEDWGNGHKDEEGKFAPQSQKKADTAAEDDAASVPVLPIPPGDGDVDLVIGFGRYHNIVDDTGGPTKLTTLSFVLGFHYKIADIVTVGAHMPITNGNVKGPLGDKDAFATNAVGAFALDGRIDIEINKRWSAPLSLSLYMPTAAGDAFADPTDNVSRAQWIINQSASATRGWEEQALFASKRFGFVPGAGIHYDKHAIHAGLDTKFEIIAKTGGNEPTMDLNGQVATLRKVTTNWVTGLFGAYEFLDAKLSPGLRAWLSVSKEPMSEGTRDYGGPQFVIEPNATTRIPLNAAKTMQLRGQLGYVLPIGGELGGKNDASVGGFRIRADFMF